MPRNVEGNSEVMSTALIGMYVRAQHKVNPLSTYVSAFMGLKLRQEATFQVLYRVKYDDIGFIQMALTRQGVLF